jgi:hypothetical protein
LASVSYALPAYIKLSNKRAPVIVEDDENQEKAQENDAGGKQYPFGPEPYPFGPEGGPPGAFPGGPGGFYPGGPVGPVPFPGEEGIINLLKQTANYRPSVFF